MKTNKAVENVEITPSKKKLTQARLPFKLISEDASTPVAPPTRKRKLSADGTEPAPKGKICKENNEVDDLVVISDEGSNDSQKLEKEPKPMNPFVKLVDTAWKKKLQKAKSPKKRKSRKSASKPNEVTESKNVTVQSDAEDAEMMDVDTENKEQSGNKAKSSKTSPKSRTGEIEKENKATDSDQNDVVLLEDSNHSSDAQKSEEQESDTENKKSNETEKQESDNDNTEVKEMAPDTPRTTRKSKSDADKVKSEETSEPAPKTPVRKAKTDSKDKANTSLPNAKLNESVSSPSTPKRSSRSSSVTNSLNDSISESAGTPANLTPKQLQKKLESAKKREDREKEKQEREKKRQEEKEERAKQRQEKEDAKKRERDEKEEQKRKEREEKEKQKELEKKLREEKEEQKKKEREEKEEQKRKEKEEKEEQKRKEKEAREEEKRKKQEALEQEKQEQELKKKKAAEAFVNFFVPKQKEKEKEQPKAIVSQNSILSSFTIKADMRLAPLIRVEMSETQKKDMEQVVGDQKLREGDLYLKNLKKKGVKIGCSGKTWPLTDKEDDDDVMIIEDELPPIEGADEILTCEPATREKLRPKLFSFHENRRPPYWGTWRKKSTFVTARRPFGQEKQLDYDVESDEDWEEEQEGESLDGSVAGDDDEPDDDYEVDNEVFVPHGYLSDEEATMDEEEDKDNVLSLSPETQKARLKNLEDEFETEMKKPTEKLKPRLYGLIWENQDGGKPEKCIDALWNYFGKLAMIMDDTAIDGLLQPPTESQDPEKKKVKKKKVLAEGEQQSPKSDKKKKVKPEKEVKKAKPEVKQETKKNQPGINSFLTKLKST